MSKKKRIKKIFENAPIESADVNDKSTESVPADAQSEESSPDTNAQAEIIETSSESEESFGENTPLSEEANTGITESVSQARWKHLLVVKNHPVRIPRTQRRPTKNQLMIYWPMCVNL
jgi:hypothetical protein